jgi:lipoprotein NlpI
VLRAESLVRIRQNVLLLLALQAVGWADVSTELASLDAQLLAHPGEIPLLSRRGDLRLWQGQPEAAVADFERMVALDPREDAPHWRLGIAYYLAGQFSASSRQFSKYHAHDSRDRENGLWKFMADARRDGIGAARRTMLPYREFDREPFPDLYALFEGRLGQADFFSGLERRGLNRDPRAMFFARYYAGVLLALEGNRGEGIGLVRAAVNGGWGPRAENGRPAYMWQVARLHLSALERETGAVRPR